ncbi:MAG: hypothetical protein R3C59_11955 [Planctomycetaceae bacterium]
MKLTTKLHWIFALCLFGISLAGCADEGGATSVVAASENTICPCMGGKVDGTTSVEWNGKTIGFCCPPCVDTWNEMTDEERTAALSEAASGNSPDHSDHADHADHPDHENHGDGHAEDAQPAADTPNDAPPVEATSEPAQS